MWGEWKRMAERRTLWEHGDVPWSTSYPMFYLGRILHDIAAPSLFHTPARQNVTILEILISKPFICGDEQRRDAREKKKRRSTWRREVSGLEGLTLYYEVGFKVEVFRAGYPDRTPLLLCALVFARYITNSLSSRLYNFSLINAILYCDVRIKSSITILIWIMHIFKRQCSTPSEGELYLRAKL